MLYNLLMIKKLKKLFLNNLFVFVIACAVVFVLLVSLTKIFFSRPKYVYAKVKISQGLWWANTTRPQLWMLTPVTKGLKETDFAGNPVAEVLSVNYYPWFQEPTSQYNAFMTMRLKVTGNGKKTSYQYDRGSLSVGSPVVFDFPTISLSGTVIEISEKPIKNDYVEKVIRLSKSYALDWEYDDIIVGDKYFDGEETVFEITDKSSVDEYSSILNFDSVYTGSAVSAQNYPQVRKRIEIIAKIKLKRVNNYYVFGEEQIVSTGKDFYLSLPSVVLNNYRVTKFE